MKDKQNALLKLLQTRWDMFIKDMPDVFRVPDPPKDIQAYNETVAKAIDEYASWHVSDPFARGRITLHIKRGLENAYEVLRDYRARNLAREVARRNALNAANTEKANA